MTRPLIRLNPAELFDASQNHHAQGTLVDGGRLAFFSGQIAWQRGVEIAPPSLAAQTEIVCRNLRSCLDSVGAAKLGNFYHFFCKLNVSVMINTYFRNNEYFHKN